MSSNPYVFPFLLYCSKRESFCYYVDRYTGGDIDIVVVQRGTTHNKILLRVIYISRTYFRILGI